MADEATEKKGRYGKNLSPTSCNQVLSTIRILLKYGVTNRMLSYDPSAPIDSLEEKPREKSFLEIGEIRKIFQKSKIQELWNGSLMHYAMNLLAACTGMRLGECQAVQNQNVFDGYVHVEYSWARKYGMTEPKYGSKRDIPVLTRTQACLNELVLPYLRTQRPRILFFGVWMGVTQWDIRRSQEGFIKRFEESVFQRMSVESEISPFIRGDISAIRCSGLTRYQTQK